MTIDAMVAAAQAAVRAEVERFTAGLEDRLARAMQKALDVVVSEHDDRILKLEEDMAKLMRKETRLK